MNHTVTSIDTEASVNSTQSKALAPKLRFKFFNDQWIKMNYGDIYSFYSTNSFSRDNLNYESGAVKNIHYGDIHTKFKTLFDIQKEEVPFINSVIDINKIKEECFCKEKDLIIADASEDYADIGKTIELININNEKIIAGLHTFLARPNKHEMAKGFAGYLVQTWHFRKQVMTIAQGTKVLSISTGRLSNLKLHLPSLPEQQKIAAFLSAVDEKIQLLTRKKELLTQYKKGVMQQLFSGKLRFKDDQGKDFPEWEEKRLGEVATFYNGKAYTQKELLDVGKYKVLRVGNFFSNSNWYYSDLELESNKYCENGDLLYAWSASFGPKIWYGEKTIYHYHIWKVENNKQITKQFLFHVLNNETEIIKTRSSNGFALLHITKGTIENWKCTIPSILEQNAISSFVDQLNIRLNSLEKQITQTQTFKKGLLQQMFV